MKKFSFLLFTFLTLTMFSQQKNEFWDNVRFGGSFSMNFGSQTNIGISPSAIYDFDNGFSLGTGLNYVYSKIDNFKTNVYGVSLISLYQIPKVDIQLSGEFEQSFAKQTDSFGSLNTSFPALYLGAAYNTGNFAVGFRYDILYDNSNIYASAFSPIVRFYF
ncbi:hypothetical protein [Polaribacter sp. Asnod1-A03]|uniref:hypothetical protein n=1 Tax=Polaribacter sp. Asnod1-A03 TaxID=3160581 RepID=UPI003867B544